MKIIIANIGPYLTFCWLSLQEIRI